MVLLHNHKKQWLLGQVLIIEVKIAHPKPLINSKRSELLVLIQISFVTGFQGPSLQLIEQQLLNLTHTYGEALQNNMGSFFLSPQSRRRGKDASLSHLRGTDLVVMVWHTLSQ